MRLYRSLALAAILSVGAVGASFAGSTTKAKTHKKVAAASAPMYECAHCNIQMTAKEAKAHAMKCSACGAKLTLVKKPTSKSKKA